MTRYAFHVALIQMLLLLLWLPSAAQETTTDETLSNSVTTFFNWYLKAIADEQFEEFEPQFVEAADGTTTLEMTRYLRNLEKYGMSSALVAQERSSYNECMEHLKRVRFSDFSTTFSSLEEFENARCDFGNAYRWTGGQEPIDDIRITSIEWSDEDHATVTIQYVEFDESGAESLVWGKNRIGLVKVSGNWKIESIQSRDQILEPALQMMNGQNK